MNLPWEEYTQEMKEWDDSFERTAHYRPTPHLTEAASPLYRLDRLHRMEVEYAQANGADTEQLRLLRVRQIRERADFVALAKVAGEDAEFYLEGRSSTASV